MSKARDKRRRQKNRRAADPLSSKQCLRKLQRVFGENSSAMMRLASDGASPSEIADQLQLEQSEAERFIEAFTQLPCGLDRVLLRAPSLLSKQREMSSMIRSAVRSASLRRPG